MTTKITIEIDGPPTTVAQTESGRSGCTVETTGAANHGTSIGAPDPIAEAEASGAINAGPAPSFLEAASPAPIAASIGGEVARADDVSSAGAAPQHGAGEPEQSGAASEQPIRRGATPRRRRATR